MQICLQTERKNALRRKMLGMFLILLLPVMTMLSFDGNMPEKPNHSAHSSKYLSVMSTFANPEQNNNQPQEQLQDQKMNNLVEENAKIAQTIPRAQNEPVKITNDFVLDSVNVYDVEKQQNITLSLEEYVVGCVIAEMPANFHSQALMAQAIATRTFTVRKTLFGKCTAHPDSFVCTDSAHCQSFIHPDEYAARGDGAKQNLEKIRQAVKATEGIIAVYDNCPINAVYHASSGFETLSSAQVWGGTVPYLLGVKAPEGENACSKEYTYTYEQLSNILTSYSGKTVECFSQDQSLITVSANANNCVQNLTVSDVTYDNIQLRDILSLRSSDFSISFDQNGVTLVTYGYGHRVGLSQCGADALAKQGYSHKDILAYYYQGIDFAFMQ